MNFFQKFSFILLLCSYSEISAEENGQDPNKKLEDVVSAVVVNTTSTPTVTILSEIPVNVSYMPNAVTPVRRPILNQADYYHSVVPSVPNFVENYQYPRGEALPLPMNMILPQYQQRQPKRRRFPGLNLGSINPIEILMTMISQKLEFIAQLRQLKRNYKNQKQAERRLSDREPDSGDVITRVVRGAIQKGVNKFQKHTKMLELFVEYRKNQLQTFLEIPLVDSVMRNDNDNPDRHHLIRLQADSGQLPHSRNMLSRFPYLF